MGGKLVGKTFVLLACSAAAVVCVCAPLCVEGGWVSVVIVICYGLRRGGVVSDPDTRSPVLV